MHWHDATRFANRRALVVGVSTYIHFPKDHLGNPVNDVAVLDQALQDVGFDVVTLIDPNREEFEAALLRFSDELTERDTALFYFSGHGVSYRGHNVLCLKDTRFNTSIANITGVYALNDLVAMIDRSAARSLYFIDACRTSAIGHRISAGPGMARPNLQVTRPAFIGLAAAPGQVAFEGTETVSLFTSAIVANLNANGVDLNEFMRRVRNDVLEMTQNGQTPWQSSSMKDTFAFVPISYEPVWRATLIGTVAMLPYVLLLALDALQIGATHLLNAGYNGLIDLARQAMGQRIVPFLPEGGLNQLVFSIGFAVAVVIVANRHSSRWSRLVLSFLILALGVNVPASFFNELGTVARALGNYANQISIVGFLMVGVGVVLATVQVSGALCQSAAVLLNPDLRTVSAWRSTMFSSIPVAIPMLLVSLLYSLLTPPQAHDVVSPEKVLLIAWSIGMAAVVGHSIATIVPPPRNASKDVERWGQGERIGGHRMLPSDPVRRIDTTSP